MRQNFLSAFILLCLITSSFFSQVRLGPFIGTTISSLSSGTIDSIETNFSNKTDLIIGGLVNINLSPSFQLVLEPMYIQKSIDNKKEYWGTPITSQLSFSYMDLPVMMKLSLNNSGINPYLVGGGTISYLLKAKEIYNCELGKELYGESVDIKDNINDLDYSWTLGGGLSIPIGHISLFIEGRYSKGLTDIFDSDDTDIKHEGYQFLGGITIPIGQGDDHVDVVNCTDKEWRIKHDSYVKKCIWKLPTYPKISVKKQLNYGEHAIVGAEDWLTELGEELEFIDDPLNWFVKKSFSHIPGIDDVPPTSKLGYAASILKIGGRATKAAKRWTEDKGKMLLYFTATIEMKQVTVKCAPIEICIDGVWVDAGIKPIEKPTKKDLNIRHEYSSEKDLDHNKSFDEQIRMMWNGWYRIYGKDWDAYNNDPCDCEPPKPTSIDDTPKVKLPETPKKKSCDPIREHIRKTKEEISLGEAHIEKLEKETETNEEELNKMKKDWENSQKTISKKIELAEKELELANIAWDMLIANVSAYTSKKMYKQKGKEISEQIENAQNTLKTAKEELSNNNNQYQNDIKKLEVTIKSKQKTKAEKQEIIEIQKKELGKLEEQLKECLRTGGF